MHFHVLLIVEAVLLANDQGRGLIRDQDFILFFWVCLSLKGNSTRSQLWGILERLLLVPFIVVPLFRQSVMNGLMDKMRALWEKPLAAMVRSQ